MEIKSNTLGKLSKIKNGSVFSNQYIFVKELLQNSQRGKAKNVYITLEDNYISFTDDGIGCKDPESVFTLDKSEWITTNEGFGIGFWSCLALNNLKEVRVSSYNWESLIDIENLFANEDLSVPINKTTDKLKGFSVKLVVNDRFSLYDKCDIEREIEEVAKYLTFDVYLNDKLIEKEDIFENVYGEFVKDVENRFFKARLRLDESRYGTVKLFYDQRFVCYLYTGVEYISGIIAIKKDKLTLKEPDRAVYVIDNKFEDFVTALKKETKKIYLDFIKSNESEDLLEQFSEGVNFYLKVNEYEKYIFLNEDFEFDLAIEKAEEKEVESDDNIESEVAVDSNEEEMEYNEDYNIDEEPYSDNNYENLDSKEDFNRDEFKRDDFKVIQKPMNYIEKDSKSLKVNELSDSNFKFLKQVKNMVWLYEKDVNSYSEEISLARYCNLKVCTIKNILQEEVMKKYKKLHISDLKDSLIEEFDTRNIGIKNKKEESFIKLLIPICKKYNIPVNTFSIANLSTTVKLNINDKLVYKKQNKNSKDKVYTCAICTGTNILLDRNYLNLSKFSISGGKLGIAELSLVMIVSRTIAHELAHYLYNTLDNTINHYKIEDKIHQEIVKLYTMDRENVLNLINNYN